MSEAPKNLLFKRTKKLALDNGAGELPAAIGPLGVFEHRDVLEATSWFPADDAAGRRDRIWLLQRAIAALPPECAKVFMLRKVQGMSQKEIAVQLNISMTTVEHWVAVGLLRCRAFMPERGGAPGGGGGNAPIPNRSERLFLKPNKAE